MSLFQLSYIDKNKFLWYYNHRKNEGALILEVKGQLTDIIYSNEINGYTVITVSLLQCILGYNFHQETSQV